MTFPYAEVSFGSVSSPMLLALAILAVLYWRRAHSLASAPSRRVKRWRQVSFYGSVALLVGERLSPLDAAGATSFLSHMLEHLLIGDLAALLMVLGLTGPLLVPILRISIVAWLRVLTHPLVALSLWLASLYLWHLPFMFEAALEHDSVHVFQHMMFFGVGFNFWMALFGPLPKPAWFTNFWALGYIVAARLAGVLLGNVFVFSNNAFYDPYKAGGNIWGLSPAADQSVAGAAMMIEGSIIGFTLFGWLFMRAAIEGEQTQDLVDLANEKGVDISQRRSARAAASGRTDLLRERIEKDLGVDRDSRTD